MSLRISRKHLGDEISDDLSLLDSSTNGSVIGSLEPSLGGSRSTLGGEVLGGDGVDSARGLDDGLDGES